MCRCSPHWTEEEDSGRVWETKEATSCRAVKVESVTDLQDIFCCMVLAECVYKVIVSFLPETLWLLSCMNLRNIPILFIGSNLYRIKCSAELLIFYCSFHYANFSYQVFWVHLKELELCRFFLVLIKKTMAEYLGCKENYITWEARISLIVSCLLCSEFYKQGLQ